MISCSCEACGKDFTISGKNGHTSSRACSRVCRVKLWRQENPERHRRSDLARKRQGFAENKPWAVNQRESNRLYKKANRARCNERERLRKAGLRKDRFVESVDPDKLFDMHGGICGICKQVIEGEFEVDHVKPLSKDGEHSYANTQPAHPLCNRRKHNKEEAELRSAA